MPQKGKLFVCPTPIGNLEDITIRVLRILEMVDFIAAEDTRHAGILLRHYGIHTPLISYYEHNEQKRSAEILQKLHSGESCALISDAGMPGISDPGQVIIGLCLREDIEIDVLPGANAALTALVLSGMPANSFLYLGFLPRKKGERKKVLEGVANLAHTVIFYEAPHRLVRLLQEILEFLGDRETAVTRELTKIHQTVYRGLTSKLLAYFQSVPPKGECCLLLAPFQAGNEHGEAAAWLKELDNLEQAGQSGKEAMKLVAKKYNVSKREIYQARLDITKKAELFPSNFDKKRKQ